MTERVYCCGYSVPPSILAMCTRRVEYLSHVVDVHVGGGTEYLSITVLAEDGREAQCITDALLGLPVVLDMPADGPIRPAWWHWTHRGHRASARVTWPLGTRDARDVLESITGAVNRTVASGD